MSKKYRGCLMKKRTYWNDEDEFCYFEFNAEDDRTAIEFMQTLVYFSNHLYDKRNEPRGVYTHSLRYLNPNLVRPTGDKVVLSKKIKPKVTFCELRKILKIFYYSKNKKCFLREARMLFINFKPNDRSIHHTRAYAAKT